MMKEILAAILILMFLQWTNGCAAIKICDSNNQCQAVTWEDNR